MAIAPHHFFILEPVSAAKLFSLIAMGIGYSAPHPRSIPLHDRQGVLAGEKSLEGIARLILSGRARRIVVLTGAGVSVSAGIPDFRTPGSGLYSNLEKYSLRTPQDIFDIAFFREQPTPFFHLAREIFPGRFFPSVAHFFVRLLERHGLLQRLYTQNIDTLDCVAGISSDRLVEAHGSFMSASCMGCRAQYSYAWQERVLFGDTGPGTAALQRAGRIEVSSPGTGTPPSPAPRPSLDASVALDAAPSSDSESPIVTPVGDASDTPAHSPSTSEGSVLRNVVIMRCDACGSIVKPDITFFGESVSPAMSGRCTIICHPPSSPTPFLFR